MVEQDPGGDTPAGVVGAQEQHDRDVIHHASLRATGAVETLGDARRSRSDHLGAGYWATRSLGGMGHDDLSGRVGHVRIEDPDDGHRKGGADELGADEGGSR